MERKQKQKPLPSRWSFPVPVDDISEAGGHYELTADAPTRDAVAKLAGLRSVGRLEAVFDVAPRGAGVVVTGMLKALVSQTCVVTLDPIENDIDEPIDLIFAPPEQIPALSDLVDEPGESDAEIPDPLEPIEHGMIDLGRLATDALFLGIDPYPRKPDAVFEPPMVAEDPEDHPFAALKALRVEPKPAAPNKPGKR